VVIGDIGGDQSSSAIPLGIPSSNDRLRNTANNAILPQASAGTASQSQSQQSQDIAKKRSGSQPSQNSLNARKNRLTQQN